MTKIRQEAIKLLEQIPEDKIIFTLISLTIEDICL